ncbi:transporter substrate-binding domain-containing protein [Microbulbifer rhizosphaerae]|uniref:Membrane-bound lytic murein transglycosylase F n=1 Tax=Microbulbifer rhizosphaerae TaxID=1562603 RepID=A0A7W4WHI8_9GAMM|nr:transporter substrate-binding domain-containing protein [Microbulbifer rhizosphaerae]MBB3063711.1 membrane-bound lytic murein transglycosylase F [Microbulbifer rhizosphaerae]
MSPAPQILCTLLIALLCIATGCERDQEAGKKDGEVSVMGEYPVDAYDNYTETGDLDAIKRRGRLRILVDFGTRSLHRSATRQAIEIEQAIRLARHLGLKPVVLYANSSDDLIPLLNAGKGDIIANNFTITEERQRLVDFSTPMAGSRLVLVSRPGVGADHWKRKTLTVTAGTTYEAKGRKFVERHPGLKLEVVEKDCIDLAVDVAQGSTDFTIIDEFSLDLVLQFRDDLKKSVFFPERQQLAWAVRKHSPQLLEVVNDEIRPIELSHTSERFTGDLDEIRERGVLRAVTRNSPGSYFMWKGRLLGYEYEMLEEFARNLGLRLEIIVAAERDDFVEYLNTGRADIAAGLLPVTGRGKQEGIAFSDSYLSGGSGIVARKGDGIKSPEALSGRTVHVRQSSSQHDALKKLQRKVPGIEMELAPETMSSQQIIHKVAKGDYDLALVDEVTVKLERRWRDDIHFTLKLQAGDYAWLMRGKNPELLASVNEFFGHRETAAAKALSKKYFDFPRYTRPEITELTAEGHISPYDRLVRKYARDYGLDWRLVVAQIFQESSFNPRAKSWAGTRGLLQVMPVTGRQVEENLYDPEIGMRAGLKYLKWLHGKFKGRDATGPENAMWFTLAAYSAGPGHVYDAKDLAEEMGWDRKVWFGNVEKAMLLLSQRKYYKKARYGYARGREPVDYVRRIEARFHIYAALLDAHRRANDN